MPKSTQEFQLLQKELILQLQLFRKKMGEYPNVNLTIQLSAIPPLLTLLKGQSVNIQTNDFLLPTIYWQDREQKKTLASFGTIQRLNEIPNAIGEELYLGGMAFQSQDEQWQDFPETLFIRPMIVFEECNELDKHKKFRVIFHFNGKHSVQQSIECLQALNSPKDLAPFINQQLSREDLPNKTQWADLVDLAIEYKALLPKVVLSRSTALLFAEPIDAWDIMGLWQQANPNSFHYAFQLSAQHCFISCSPERLYARENNTVVTEALAGTVNRGRDKREDQLLKDNLLHDKKIDRENYLVQEFIIANLKQLKAQVTQLPAHVLQLQHVQHLCIPIQAIVNKETKDSDLLYKLHPTPAVAGTPKLPALQFINDKEPYIRGWYAGAIGIIEKNRSDFSVAIRSALISNNRIELFAGAGIVTGSIAAQEWQELDNKIQTILNILGAQ